MTLLIKILSVLGILLLAVFLLALWIILVPRHFWVEWCKQDGPAVKMNIGPFKIGLYPPPEFFRKKEKASREKKDADKQQKEHPMQDKQETGTPVKGATPRDKVKFNPLDDIQLSMQLLKDIVSAARGIMAKILKAIKFRDVSFTVPVHHRDVHKTQKQYGIITNSFYGLAVFLQKHMQITFKSPIFVADFAGTYGDSTYFYCQITASPVLLLAAGWYAYTQYKTIIINHIKAPDATKKENDNG